MVNFVEPVGSLSYDIKKMNADDIAKNIDDYAPKTSFLDHQLRSTALGLVEDTYYFALGMGLGKTKIVIDTFAIKKQRGEVKRMFVLAPVATLGHWQREIHKHSHLSAAVVQGSADEKINQIFNCSEDVVICSMEWISTLFKKVRGNGILHNSFKNIKGNFDFLVLDECHKIKERNTQLFKFCREYLIDIKCRYLMSGTPIGNSYTNVWSQFYLMDKGMLFEETYEDFLRKWFIERPRRLKRGGWIPPEYILRKDMKNDFFNLFWQKAINFSDDDCEYLTDLNKIQFPVILSDNEKRVYLETMKSREEENSLEFDLMRLVSGCQTFNDKHAPVLSKQKALLDLLKRATYENSKVIVWHFLVDEGRALEKLLIPKFKSKVAFVRGETTKKDKEEVLSDWSKGEYDILVTNPASLGTGVDLIEANIAVYFSNPADVIGRVQSEKRIHRTGQKRDCIIFDLVCPGTVDDFRFRRLTDKTEDAKQLTQAERNREIVKLAMNGS